MDDADIARIDGLLAVWRQGDVVLQEEDFVHLAALTCPLTAEAEAAQAPGDRGLDKPSIAGVYTAVLGGCAHPNLRHRPFLPRAALRRGRPADPGR